MATAIATNSGVVTNPVADSSICASTFYLFYKRLSRGDLASLVNTICRTVIGQNVVSIPSNKRPDVRVSL